LPSWTAEARTVTTAAPKRPKPRPARPAPRAVRRRHVRARGAIAWIAVGAVLLAGIVFVNLAVLRLNLELDNATKERANLRAENAGLQWELSSSLASPRIQALARRQDHLVPADQSTIGYVNLGR